MEGSTRRARRLLVTAAALTALAALTLASSGSAAKSFEPVNVGEFTPAWTPNALVNRTMSVIVEVAGKPVALVEADTGRDLSESEEAQVKADLDRVQQPIELAVERLGGKVEADYKAAYNGIRIEIKRDKLDDIEQLDNVVDVHAVTVMDRPQNLNGVPLIGAPSIWDGAVGTPFHGEGIKTAVLDSGIDFTHANFAGPGTPEAFAAADAADTVAADPTMFGPAAPKVKGGIDLVGDGYDASSDDPAVNTPVPDPNPLDCTTGNVDGHGSHVSGTATGFGVLSNGDTYTGAYDADTLSSNTFRIGPGVAPEADLYSVRLFGCSGSTDVTTDAIEWAVDNDMDVINMSLGSNFGSADDPSAEASNNAAAAGVIVVASAGNAGPAQYITGSPATATGAISVAANDPIENLLAATISNAGFTGGAITAINANGLTPVPAGPLDVAVLRDSYPSGPVGIGCDPNTYLPFDATTNPVGYPGGVAGKIVVTQRGVCARVARAIFGEQAGAAVVVMINNAAVLPPFEGPITENPDPGGIQFNVTIPFLGVRGVLGPAATADGDEFAALDDEAGETTTVTLADTTIANANFKGFASFSSGGPRNGDSFLKPNITAPGQSILSTNTSTGDQGSIKSGTSMAAPHTTGAAALVRQAHPSWSVENIKAAMENTGSPADATSGLTPFRISRGGTGLVQPLSAAKTHTVAKGTKDTGAVSFGFAESEEDFVKKGRIKLENLGSSTVTFSVSAELPQGSPHSIELDHLAVEVKAGKTRNLNFTLTVPVDTAGSSAAFRETAGQIMFTPLGGTNNGVALRVPYYLVPRASSDVETDVDDTSPSPSTTAEITNEDGGIAGVADFYSWGLRDGAEGGVLYNDLRAVGVQSFSPAETGEEEQLLVFAVNVHKRWSHPSVSELDVLVDVNNDGVDDYAVVGADNGLLQTGSFNGQYVVAVFPLGPPAAPATIFSLAVAPTDSSTALLPVFESQLCAAGHPCLNSVNPRFTYRAESFALRAGDDDVMPGTAEFNAFNPSLTNNGTFDFIPVVPGGSASTTVDIDPAEWALTPSRGLMVVTFDNPTKGKKEAQLIRVRLGN